MRIKELRQAKGLSQKEFARILNVGISTLSQWETGKREPDIEVLNMLADYFGVTVDRVIGRTTPKGVLIPVLGKVPAGIPLEAVEEILDWEEISPALARTGEYFALKVQGDSMEPRICEGDVLIVKKQSTAETGNIVIALINGDDATVKRFKRTDNGIMLVPNNMAYDPMAFTNEEIIKLPVEIVGVVVENRQKYK